MGSYTESCAFKEPLKVEVPEQFDLKEKSRFHAAKKAVVKSLNKYFSVTRAVKGIKKCINKQKSFADS